MKHCISCLIYYMKHCISCLIYYIKDSDVTELNIHFHSLPRRRSWRFVTRSWSSGQCIFFMLWMFETSTILYTRLQKIQRPKSSDSLPIRNLCKHSLPCPHDPMRGDSLVINTEQKDWLLRSQKWPTSIFFALAISIHNQENRLWELLKWPPNGMRFNLSSNSLN